MSGYLQLPALALATVTLLCGCLAQPGPTLTAAAAHDQAKAGALTLIDIRTPAEWRETGIAAGAAPIMMQDPKGPDGFADAVLAQVRGDYTAPIALICRTGNRSAHMQQTLSDHGFTRVYSVADGMAGSAAGPGWIGLGLPVKACKDC